MIRCLLLLLLAAWSSAAVFHFDRDPATADTIGASMTNLNATSNAFTCATSQYDPTTDAIVLPNTRRQRNQVIGTTTYAMDLIEGARTNLLATGTSGRFDQWTAVAGGTVTADTTAAPNGEVIAQTLTDPGASLSGVSQAETVANDSLIHVFSVYVLKTAGGTAPTYGITEVLSGGTPVTVNARINTDTGAQQYGSNANVSVVNADATYWRVIVVITNNTSGNVTLTETLYPAAAAYGASVDDAAATGTAICTFADLNKSPASSTSFFASSFNSNRNCLLQSETLNTTWTKTRTTVTSDSTANPLDSAVTADTINEDNTATNTHSISQVFTKPAAAIQFEFSTYIKQSGRTWSFIELTDTGIANGAGMYFDVANGVKGTAVALGTGFTLDASTITAVGSYYRCTATVTTNTATTIRANVFTATADLGVIIVTPLNAAALICYGNQLVYGAKPLNYWATTTAGLRAADTLSSTVTTSTTAGTIITIARPSGWTGDQDGITAWGVYRDSGSVVLGLRTAATTMAVRSIDAGGTETTTLTPGLANGANTVIGHVWDAASLRGYINGPASGTPDTSLTPPYTAATLMYLGANSATGAANYFNGGEIVFYKNGAIPPSTQQIFANGVAP